MADPGPESFTTWYRRVKHLQIYVCPILYCSSIAGDDYSDNAPQKNSSSADTEAAGDVVRYEVRSNNKSILNAALDVHHSSV